MTDGTPPPDSWAMTPEQVENLVQSTLGEDSPNERALRPDGGSLLSGVGQCLYDEVEGLWELGRLVIEISEDLDIAVDGNDDWFFMRSASAEARELALIYVQLERGSRVFTDMPMAQQQGLFKLYAKFEIIKQTLWEIGQAGINLLAAYDVYWSEDDLGLFAGVQYRSMAYTAQAISLLFSDAEWQAMADSGKAIADSVTRMIEDRWATDPWGTAGYAVCLVALFLSPTKIVRALRPLKTALAQLGRATRVSDLQRILRTNGVDVPSWLGGPSDAERAAAAEARRAAEAAETARLARQAEEAARVPETTGPEIVVEGERPDVPAREGNPARAEDPTDRRTPDPDADTTRVERAERARRAGDLAEADARRRLDEMGYDTFELKNASEHGPDIIAVNRDDPTKIIVVEVKANSSTLTTRQEAGGSEYLRDVFDRRIGQGEGPGGWNVDDFDDFLDDLGVGSREDVLAGDFEIWRYKDVDGDNPASVGNPSRTPWTPGRTGTVFELDANGDRVMDGDRPAVGPRRTWDNEPYQTPGD